MKTRQTNQPKRRNIQVSVAGIAPSGKLSARRPIVVATDGAADPERLGLGYIATSGHYGLSGHAYDANLSSKDRAVVSELRAVWYALLKVRVLECPIEVRCDSEYALSCLRSWSNGSTAMPGDYQAQWRFSGKKPTLVRLQEFMAQSAGVTAVHQKGHVGDPLNETADSMAKLAIRCSRGMVEKSIAAGLAKDWAAQTLRGLS